ncbi:MAG: DMT family transporter, partial [Paracoccaceae bacterium]
IWAGWQGRVAGVLGLTVYMFAFSLAYASLDAGAGALILFGAVQMTMFAGALLAGELVPRLRWLGAGMAFGGLVVLLWPGMEASLSLAHALMMAGAGVGFGVYSLAGRRSGDPLAGTAANFMLAVPLGLAAGWALGLMPVGVTGLGVMLAVVSGAVTSGLGYALWYVVVPQLGAGRAAVAQLSVPVLTAAAGVVLLNEAVDARFILAAVCVLGGVAVASRA